jgi:fructose-specific phosphotransferase system component IIB
MKIEIELTEAEIKEAVLGIIAHDYAKRLDAERSTVKYVTRKEIKEVIREIHDYDVCEISACEIVDANKEIFDWIDECVGDNVVSI